MVTVLRKLEPFTDAETGNCVEYEGEPRAENISIKFRGNGNRLVVAADAKIFRLSAVFDCSNGVITIGGNSHGTPFRGTLRVGQDSRIVIGHNVSSTDTVYMSAAEGTTIEIGEDVMFATGNQLRADDGTRSSTFAPVSASTCPETSRWATTSGSVTAPWCWAA